MLKKIAIQSVLFVAAFFKYFQPRACRFYPSCSAYSVEAFGRLGVIRGFYKTIHRICRCHPFCEGGYDPLIEGSK